MRVRRLMWLGACCLAVTAASSADYTMARYNVRRTGTTDEKLAAPLALQWEFATDKDPGFTCAPLCVGNRVFYCALGTVYALDAETGETKWQYNTRYAIRATPIFRDGRLLVFNAKGELHVLDVADETGERLVQKLAFNKGLNSEAALVGQTLYVADDGGQVYAVDLATYQEQKVEKFAGMPSGGLLHDGQFLYFTGIDNILYSYDLRRKLRLWAKSQGSMMTAPVIVDGGLVVGTRDKLVRVKGRIGTPEWSFTGDGALRGAPAVAGNTVYFAGRKEMLYSVDLKTGKKLGELELDAPSYTAPTVADQDIYVGTNIGSISCVGAADMKLKWHYRCNPIESVGPKPTLYRVASAPVVSNGNLFVVTTLGTLYCFRADAVDTGKPKLYLPEIATNAVDGTEVAIPMLDDELRRAIEDDAKAKAKEDEEPEIPEDAKLKKLPGKQKTFRFQTYLYDEGSGVDCDGVRVAWDGTPYTGEMRVFRNRQQLIVHLLGGQQRTGAALDKIADGEHKLTIRVPDFKGNVAQREFTFQIDNSLPPLEPAKKKPKPQDQGEPGGTSEGSGGAPPA